VSTTVSNTTATAARAVSKAELPPMSEAEWLALDQEQLAAIVRRRNLSVLLSIDGSRRFYLMRTGATATKVDRSNFTHYVEFIAVHLSRVVSLLFELGVTDVLKPVLLPDQFDRPQNYLKMAIAHSEPMFLGSAFRQMYAQHGARARLYGDFDISDRAELVRSDLTTLADRLKVVTPNAGVNGDRDVDEDVDVEGGEQEQEQEAAQAVGVQRQPTLWLGYQSLPFSQELTRRTARLAKYEEAKFGITQTGHGHGHGQGQGQGVVTSIPLIPTSYLRNLSFQHQQPHPTQAHILIGAGWLKVGGILPPWLDEGTTDIYNLGFLTLDLDEITVWRILYDHLYRRNAAGDADADYSPEDLVALDTFYRRNQGKLIGLGSLVGSGLWYADCPDDKVDIDYNKP
jgi:hypothetical protein